MIVKNNSTWISVLDKCNNIAWNYDGDSAVALSFDSLYNLQNGSIICLIKDNEEILRGIITKKSEKKFSYSYTALDYIWYFNKNKDLIQFNNITGKRAIEQLCGVVGVNCDICDLNVNINKIYNQDLSSIINDILDQATARTGIKYYKEMNKNTFTVKPIGEEKINCKYIMLNDFGINSTIEDLKNSVIVTSGNDSNTQILAKCEDSNNINKFGRLRDSINIDEGESVNAESIARTFITLNNKESWDMPINIVAIENGQYVKSNRLLYIKVDEKKIDGWYRIKSANHTLANGAHKISLTFVG